MALDTVLRRQSAIHVCMPWRGVLPQPDLSVDVEDRYVAGGLYAGIISAVPEVAGVIGNISAPFDTGEHEYDLSQYFAGASSYAIDPALETGWSFNTSSGLLTIDTDDEGSFGPYIVTATNASGGVDSNGFTVKVSQSSVYALRGIRNARGIRNYR
jgi:hypothetical protein